MTFAAQKRLLIERGRAEADANKRNTHTQARTHTSHNLAIGRVARPTLPPGSPRLASPRLDSTLLSSALFVEQHRRPRNNLSPTTDSGSDYHGPAP